MSGRCKEKRARLEARVGEIEREIARGVDAILKGRFTPDMLGNSMHDLNAERDLIAPEIVNAKERLVAEARYGRSSYSDNPLFLFKERA